MKKLMLGLSIILVAVNVAAEPEGKWDSGDSGDPRSAPLRQRLSVCNKSGEDITVLIREDEGRNKLLKANVCEPVSKVGEWEDIKLTLKQKSCQVKAFEKKDGTIRVEFQSCSS